MALLLALQYLLIITAVKEKSATYDEAVHIASGALSLKRGDFAFNNEKQPFLKVLMALPLLLTDLHLPSAQNTYQYHYADRFLYRNHVSADTILLRSRMAVAALAILLGVFIYKWAYALFGYASALWSLALYSFCPNIAAHAGIAGTDLGVAVFFFIAVYLFWRYLENPTPSRLILTGVVLGLAQASKASAILLYLLFPLLSVLWMFYTKRFSEIRKFAFSLIGIFGVSIIVLATTYGFFGFGNYFEGMDYLRKMVSSGRSAFIAENVYSHSPWWQSIYTFLVKTPIPLLVCSGWCGFLLVRAGSNWIHLAFVVVPIVSWLLMTSASPVQSGLRYILPIYPFLFVFCGSVMKARLSRAKLCAVLALGLWQVWGNIRVYPHYLTYFNELVGGPKNGYKILVDSDLDWGQDLKMLAEFVQPDDSIVLSYFGNVNPAYYGLRCQLYGKMSDVPYISGVNPSNPKREILAVSATFLQQASDEGKHTYAWLSGYKPLALLGNTIFIYDITHDVRAHEQLAMGYALAQKDALAEREWLRVIFLDPKNERAYLELGALYTEIGWFREAEETAKALLRINPKSSSAYDLLGQIYGLQGRFPASHKAFLRSLRLDPFNASARKNISVTERKMLERGMRPDSEPRLP